MAKTAAQIAQAEQERQARDALAAAARTGSPSVPSPQGTTAPTTTSTSTSSTPVKHDLLNFDAMVAEGFDPATAKTDRKSYAGNPATFITGGGTPGEKSALARKIANMTIRKGMNPADKAAIQKARMWLTGQKAGRVKGKTYWTKGSIKGAEHGNKGNVQPKPASTPKSGTSGSSSHPGSENVNVNVNKGLDPAKAVLDRVARDLANNSRRGPR